MIIPFINRFLQWLTVGIISPILSLMILSKGNSLEGIGLILGTTSAIVIILEVPSGVLSDIIGRKSIYLSSIIFSIIGFIILIFANNFFLVLGGFALLGVARAFSSGSIESVFINDYLKINGKNELHKLMTTLGAGEAIGLALGALIGGFLPAFWNRLELGDNKYNGNLIFSLGILVILFMFTVIATKGNKSNEKKNMKTHFLETINSVRNNRVIKLMLVGFFVWGFSINAIELYWQPQLKNIIGSDSQTWIFGIANSGYFIATLLGALFITFFYSKKKVSYFSTLFITRIFMGSLIIILSMQKSVSLFISVYWIMFFFNGIANIPESTIYNMESSENNRSSSLSIASLFGQLGAVTGALLFSALISIIPITSIWIIAGTLFLMSSIVYLIGKKYSNT